MATKANGNGGGKLDGPPGPSLGEAAARTGTGVPYASAADANRVVGNPNAPSNAFGAGGAPSEKPAKVS